MHGLAARVEELEGIIRRGGISQIVQHNTVNNTVNNIGSVTIAPWGAPLQLTDADVEAALASIPGVAGNLALPEVVAELVKRAHLPEGARNVHLNPKRGDQALARTATGAWAAMPLTEATAALFDGASARIATPAGRRRASALRATVPVQYRADKAMAVQLGLRPMEAHLANLVPGGPGPLLAAPAAQAAPAAPASAAVEAATEQLDTGAAVALLTAHPAAGGVTAGWLTDITRAAGVSASALVRALRQASAAGHCGMAEWQGIMALQRDTQDA